MKKFWQILGVLCLMLALAAGAAAATYEPIEVELPLIQIQVAGHTYGENKCGILLNTLFELELSASSDTPKPEEAELSSDGKTWALAQKNWGVKNGEELSNQRSFGKVVFEKAGQYLYTLQQKADSSKEYVEYDTAEHEIVVNVREEEGQLKSSITYDGEEIQETKPCVIHNEYHAGELIITCEADSESDEKTFAVMAKMTALKGYMGRLAYAVKRSDGTNESVTPDADSVTAQLAHGEVLTIIGIPKGVNFTVSAGASEGYVVQLREESGAFTNGKGSIAENNAEHKFSAVYSAKGKTVSVGLKSQLYLKGTLYGNNGVTNYDYPDNQAIFNLELESKDETAPMPGGTVNRLVKLSVSYQRRKERADKEVATRILTIPFSNIEFTEYDLQGADERTFTYIVRHGKDSQPVALPYIAYNYDNNGNENKEVEITVTLKKTDDGGLEAVQKNTPSFRDRYVSTSISMESQISGNEEVSSKALPITLSLWDQYNRPISGWQFFVDTISADGSEVRSSAEITDNKGCLTFNALNGEKTIVYGVPNQTSYEITASSLKPGYTEYDIKRIVDDEEEEAESEGILALDTKTVKRIPDGRIIYLVKNNHISALSTITLPAKTTTILKGAFSGTAAEVYVLPEKIETIEEGAFDDLPNVHLIVIPENAQTPDRSLFPVDVLLIRPDGTPVE